MLYYFDQVFIKRGGCLYTNNQECDVLNALLFESDIKHLYCSSFSNWCSDTGDCNQFHEGCKKNIWKK